MSKDCVICGSKISPHMTDEGVVYWEGGHREPDEISDDAYKVINELIADESITDIKSVDDAHDYVDWYKEKY